MALNIIVTNAGRAALVNAANTGTAPVTIAQLGLSASVIAPVATATTLPGEFKRLNTLSGDVVADDTIHMVGRDESSDVYTVRSIALYLNDGTLFAIFGQATPIIDKAAAAIMLMAIDVQFADIAATSLTFGNANFLNPPATETVQGVAEVATQAETDAGTDDTRFVTPKKLWSRLTSWLAGWGADIWRASNDGAGSGLDADLVDGRQAAEFALLSGAAFGGALSAPQLTSSGSVTAGLDGFKQAVYLVNARNPIWRFGNADAFGISYFQGTAGKGNADSIGFHFGNATLAGSVLSVHGIGGADLVGNFTATGGANFGGMIYRGPNISWDAGNDGSGSGLDADLLDGYQASDFARLTGATFSGALRSPEFTAAAAGTGSISLYSGTVTYSGYIALFSPNGIRQAYIGAVTDGGTVQFFAEGAANFGFNKRIYSAAPIYINSLPVWYSGNDGAGSGLDADLLDGFQASDFALRGYDNVFRDVYATRGDGTGVIFLGSSGGRYLHYDGSSYVMPGASLAVNGGFVWTAANDGSGSGMDADVVRGMAPSIGPIGNTIVARSPEGYVTAVYFNQSSPNNENSTAAQILTTVGTDNYIRKVSFANLISQGGIWTSANDGSGSGMDTDLWRGMTPAQLIASMFSSGYDAATGVNWRKWPAGNGDTMIRMSGLTADYYNESAQTRNFPFALSAVTDFGATTVIPNTGTAYDNFAQIVGTPGTNSITIQTQEADGRHNYPLKASWYVEGKL